MTEIFIEVLNCTLAAAIAGLAVLLLRILLRRAPKKFSYLLWAVVLFRALCPFSPESALSLMPVQSRPISQDIVYQQSPHIDTGVPAVDDAAGAVLQYAAPQAASSANPLQVWMFVLAVLWAAGAVLLVLWAAVSYWRLRRRLRTAVRLEGNVWETDRIGTAVVMGFFRPAVYLPAGLSQEEQEVILAHERVHLARKDHWFKALAFLALCIHWFNPVLWLCWHFAQKDMEMSCDEVVLRDMEGDGRKRYSLTLLRLSERQSGLFSPIAFGENGVKGRIKNVLRYKKPVGWVLVAAGLLAAGLIAGLFFNPPGERTLAETDECYDLEAQQYDRAWVDFRDRVLLRSGEDIRDIGQFLEQVRLKPGEIQTDSPDREESGIRFALAPADADGVEDAYTVQFSVGFREAVLSGTDGSFARYEVANPEELTALWDASLGQELGTSGLWLSFAVYLGGAEVSRVNFADWESVSQTTAYLLSGEPQSEPVSRDRPDAADYLEISLGADRVYFVYEEEGRYWAECQNEYRHVIPAESYASLMRYATVNRDSRMPALVSTEVYGPDSDGEGLPLLLTGGSLPEETLYAVRADSGSLLALGENGPVPADGEYPAGTVFYWVPENFPSGGLALISAEWQEGDFTHSAPLMLTCSDGFWRSTETGWSEAILPLPFQAGDLAVGEYRVKLLMILPGDSEVDAPGGGTYEQNYRGEYILRLSRNGTDLFELVLGERNFPGGILIRSADYDGDPDTPEFALGQWAGSSQMAYEIFSIRGGELVSCGEILSSEFREDFSPVFSAEDGVIRTSLYDTEAGELRQVSWAYDETMGRFVPE